MKNRLILLIILLQFMFSFAVSSIMAGNATIDAGTKYQTISGFGACSQWVESKITAALATDFWADDNVNGHAGLSIIRIGIAPQGSGSWSGACNSAKQALAINPNILVFASPWSPPANYKNNGVTTGNNTGNTGTNPGGNTNQLMASHYGDYATFLTSFVTTCKNTYGFNLYALSVQNEPDYDTSYDSCVWSNTAMDTFIGTNLGPALQAAGYTNIIMMPESFACNMNMSATTMGDANAAKYVKVIGEHLYGGGPNPLPASYSSTAGHAVEMWETEYSMKTSTNDITSGIFYANSLHKCIVDNNYNAWCYWWLVLSSGTDDEGLCDTNGTPTKRLFTLGNYSKFVRPGAVRIAATENPSTNVSTSAYIDTTLNRYVIVCINNNSSVQGTTFNLNGISTSSVTPWLTDASNDLVAQSAQPVSANSFTYNLPANSVMSFVGTMSVGPSPTNTPYAGTPTFTTTVTPLPCSVVLDECEDNNTTNNWAGSWYDYMDTNGSTIIPATFAMTAGGAPGSTAYCASINGNIVSGGYVGMGTNLAAGTNVAVDLTAYTALQFYAKGDGGAYWVQFTQPSITDGDCFGATFSAPAAWTLVTVPLSGLAQRGFGAASTFTKNAIEAVQWTYNGSAPNTYSVQVDSIKFLQACGTATNTPNYTATRTPTPTFTQALTSTFTRTASPSATYTRTATSTYSSTQTSTRTSSPTYTSTQSNTSTYTRTATPTFTITFGTTETFTPTRTSTPIFTATQSLTFTPGNTFTFTGTHTPTYTFTPTGTYSATFTPTSTRTATYTGTVTASMTYTSTGSMTSTRTVTPTFTRTATPTYSGTVTLTLVLSPTFTPSITMTWTGTPPSPTDSPTVTATWTDSASPTETRTVSPSSTITFTPSGTNTATQSGTPTFTRTPSSTNTPSNSPSDTPTITGTPTFTATRTITYSRTATPSFTETTYYSPTVTPTITDTVTGTPPTATDSPTITGTSTMPPSATPTFTGTITVSMTPTIAVTATYTPTEYMSSTWTQTVYYSPTYTFTGTDTPTLTYTGTQLPSATRTYTMTPTSSSTKQPTPTFTRTIAVVPTATYTPAAVPGAFHITDFSIYPNPVLIDPQAGLNVYFRSTQQVVTIILDVYTAAFRHIKREEVDGLSITGDCKIKIPARDFSGLSAGTYYCVVTARNGSGAQARTQPFVLIILK